jgi:hypothetical protein
MYEEIIEAFEQSGKVIIGVNDGEFQFYQLNEALDFFEENDCKIDYCY